MRGWVFVALAGCAGDPTGPTGTTGDTSGPGAATFSEVRDQVLNVDCAASSCHSGTDHNGFALAAGSEYDAIVNVESTYAPGNTLVIPGDADHSYLVEKLEAAPGIIGSPMPPPFGNLDPAKVALVRSWIDAGAAND